MSQLIFFPFRAIESSGRSSLSTHSRNRGGNSASTNADSPFDTQSLIKLLEPSSVQNIVSIYQTVSEKASKNPPNASQPNYELEAATLLVEVVLDNYELLCEESRLIVDSYIEWTPGQS